MQVHNEVVNASRQVYKSFKGTAREFIASGVTVNGKDISQPGLSLMAQYGVVKIVGEVPRPEKKKGHAEKIYSIVGKSGLKVEYQTAPTVLSPSNSHTATKQLECV